MTVDEAPRAKKITQREESLYSVLEVLVVIVGVDEKVGAESIGSLSCYPSLAHKATYICAKHPTGMIEGKERIELSFL